MEIQAPVVIKALKLWQRDTPVCKYVLLRNRVRWPYWIWIRDEACIMIIPCVSNEKGSAAQNALRHGITRLHKKRCVHIYWFLVESTFHRFLIINNQSFYFLIWKIKCLYYVIIFLLLFSLAHYSSFNITHQLHICCHPELLKPLKTAKIEVRHLALNMQCTQIVRNARQNLDFIIRTLKGWYIMYYHIKETLDYFYFIQH